MKFWLSVWCSSRIFLQYFSGQIIWERSYHNPIPTDHQQTFNNVWNVTGFSPHQSNWKSTIHTSGWEMHQGDPSMKQTTNQNRHRKITTACTTKTKEHFLFLNICFCCWILRACVLQTTCIPSVPRCACSDMHCLIRRCCQRLVVVKRSLCNK